jgi:hypothetical protein
VGSDENVQSERSRRRTQDATQAACANAHPITGTVKQSIEPQSKKLDWFLAQASRNEVWVEPLTVRQIELP